MYRDHLFRLMTLSDQLRKNTPWFEFAQRGVQRTCLKSYLSTELQDCGSIIVKQGAPITSFQREIRKLERLLRVVRCAFQLVPVRCFRGVGLISGYKDCGLASKLQSRIGRTWAEAGDD